MLYSLGGVRVQDYENWPVMVGNLNSVRREYSRHFRKKKEEFLKVKIDEHETNS